MDISKAHSNQPKAQIYLAYALSPRDPLTKLLMQSQSLNFNELLDLGTHVAAILGSHPVHNTNSNIKLSHYIIQYQSIILFISSHMPYTTQSILLSILKR